MKLLDWRPRKAEKDLSGEAPERLGGQKRWAEESATPSANSGVHNVHQTLFSEAASRPFFFLIATDTQHFGLNRQPTNDRRTTTTLLYAANQIIQTNTQTQTIWSAS